MVEVTEIVQIVFERLGYLFYIVIPYRTSYETPEEVPNYAFQVLPHYMILFLLEAAVAACLKKPVFRVNDSIVSVSQGLLQQISFIAFRGIQHATYFFIYAHWRFVTLPWNSIWTWWLYFLAEDFTFYWLHRACHEINIFWAAHQVHHSSEDFNLSTALRQSVLQYYSIWLFYLPWAFFIPPSVYLVHNQLNLLYQAMLHTQVIRSLGPLEYVLNTASHHRVHHGKNRYCIDKNYGGVLIIWDRIFGTFEAEKEEVVYGLTHPVNSFEPIYLQLHHYMHIFKTTWNTKGFKNKIYVIIKGPGWSPGKPWRGCIEDVPDAKAPDVKYDPHVPLTYKLYALLHFGVLSLAYAEITTRSLLLPQSILYIVILHQVLSLSAIGMIFEGRFYAPYVEISRCLLSLTISYFFLPQTAVSILPMFFQWGFMSVIEGIYGLSILFWVYYCVVELRSKRFQECDKEIMV